MAFRRRLWGVVERTFAPPKQLSHLSVLQGSRRAVQIGIQCEARRQLLNKCAVSNPPPPVSVQRDPTRPLISDGIKELGALCRMLPTDSFSTLGFHPSNMMPGNFEDVVGWPWLVSLRHTALGHQSIV